MIVVQIIREILDRITFTNYYKFMNDDSFINAMTFLKGGE